MMDIFHAIDHDRPESEIKEVSLAAESRVRLKDHN